MSFALLALLARWMGPDGFGAYVWLLSVAVMLLVAIEGGWPALLYREAAAAPPGATPPHASAATRHVLLACAIGAVLAALAAGPALGMAALCMGGVACANLVSARLRGAGRFGSDALWQSGTRLATALAIVAVAAWLGATPLAVFAAWTAALAVALAAWGRRWLARPRRLAAGSDWHASVWLVALEAGLVLLLRGDMALLGWIGLTPRELSHYAAGTRVTELAVLMLAPLNNVLLRSLRRAYPDAVAFRRLLRPAVLAAAGTGLALFLLSLPLGTLALGLLFGAEFRAAGGLLPWILAALPLLLANLVLAQAAVAQGREARAAREWLACGMLALAAIAAGALWRGPTAAAAGMFVAQVLLLGLSIRRTAMPPPT